MSPSLFSPLGPRYCHWCQAPLPGRSDQKFCRDSCRSMARRHGSGAATDWPARAAAAEQAVRELQAQLDQQAQAQLAAQPYELRYEELSRLLGLLAHELDDPQLVSSYLYFVEELLVAYQQHPGLVTQEATASRRLASLQQLRAELATYYQTLQARQQQALYWKERGHLTPTAEPLWPPANPVPAPPAAQPAEPPAPIPTSARQAKSGRTRS